MSTNLKILAFFSLLILVSFRSIAQSIAPQVDLTRIDGDVVIDGSINETAWEKINPTPLMMHWPSFEGQVTENTEFRVAYDDDYLYVSAVCYDSDPAGIQATTFQRDGLSQKMDHFALILDPYDDNENSLLFVVTPTGSRFDAAFKNDAQGGGPSDSWNSYWTAAATIGDDGWRAEMRIPFGSLRFQENAGNVSMGLISYRYIARKRELDIYPAIPPNWGFWSFAKASQAQTVGFEGIKNKRPWYTSPYVLAGTGYHHSENDAGEYVSLEDQNLQVGLDIQHAVSDNLNVDFTFNTDFAQVEADNQQVNLSRFSLFFPEKRKFFLERSSTFDFNYDLNNNLFYSRRIGINDGLLIPVYGGARVVGRIGKWDLGMMNMQSRSVNDISSENFGVMRLRKNVFNQRSYAGGMFTSRIDGDGNRNFAYGVDGIFNVFKQDYLQFNIAQSTDTADTTDLSMLDKSRIFLMWENRIINGFGYRVSYSSVGEEFKPGLGFERRFNFSQFGDQVFYSWFAPEESNLRQTTITLTGGVSLNNATGKQETFTTGLESSWSWDRQALLSIGFERFHDNVPAAFDLSDDINIGVGSYDNYTGTVSYSTPAVSLLSTMITAQKGTFYGGNLTTLSFTPEAVFSKYFQMEGFYQYSVIDFQDLNSTFESHLVRLNMTTSFNVKFSLSSFIQFNTLNDLSTMNIRFRYNPVDGNDLYLVFNEVINSNPESEIPRLPVSDSRALIVKYIHTFRL